MLEIENLHKSFDGFTAVREVSLTVTRGETQAVIGPNGAGKTTLFNLVTGHLQPDRGRVSFFGQPLTGLPPTRSCASASSGRSSASTFFPG